MNYMNNFLNQFIERLEKQYNYCQKVYEEYKNSSYADDDKERVYTYLNNKKQIISELIFDAKNEIKREEIKKGDKK